MLSRAPTRIVRNWISDSRQWSAYKPRPDDIIVATAPKVGTTWTQQIVSLLVFQSPEPRALATLSPWLDSRPMMPFETMLATIDAQTHRRFLKSHLPLDALPIFDEVKYIHVARDGRDACMSLLNHFNSFTPEMLARFDGIGLSDETIGRPMPRAPREPREFFLWWIDAAEAGARGDEFFHLERSYWPERNRTNFLLVHYNDLKSDLSAEMRRISNFLEIPVDEKVWPQLVEAATFDSMKRNGAQIMPGIGVAFKGGHESFLHKGTNDRWRDVLTDADLEMYERSAHKQMTPGLFEWVRHGRLLAGDPQVLPD